MMSEESSSIRATRIGGHAWQYLTTQPRKGRVVSSFSGGINLLFEDGEAFVPLQTSAVPLHPWAIEMAGRALLSTEGTTEGTPVSAEARDLLVGGTHIVLSNVQIENLSFPGLSTGKIAIARHNFPNLERFVEEARKTHPPDPFQPQIDAILRRWYESSEANILLDLIGLGTGSTPSGDDVLVGILAGLSILEKTSRKEVQQPVRLRSGIRARVKGRTTLPSAQMLLAACEQSFGEPVLDLLADLTAVDTPGDKLLPEAAHVAQLGHHSGLAILLGLTKSLLIHVML